MEWFYMTRYIGEILLINDGQHMSEAERQESREYYLQAQEARQNQK